MGWTSDRSPKRSAVSWKTNPPIMLAMPSSQTGRRASRTTSPTSNPLAWVPLAPLRWHTDDVAVHTLAATASTIALSITVSLPPDDYQLPVHRGRGARHDHKCLRRPGSPARPGRASSSEPAWKSQPVPGRPPPVHPAEDCRCGSATAEDQAAAAAGAAPAAPGGPVRQPAPDEPG